MTFARTPTNRSKIALDNYVRSKSENQRNPSTAYRRSSQPSTVTLSHLVPQSLAAALNDDIYPENHPLSPSNMHPYRTRNSGIPPTPIPRTASAPPSGGLETAVLPEERVTKVGARIHQYPDGRIAVVGLPPQYQDPEGIAAIFAELHQPLHDYPSAEGSFAPSAFQFLQKWISSDPQSWTPEDPYFSRGMSSVEGMTWQINHHVLDYVVVAMDILRKALNAAYDTLDPISPATQFNPDPEDKMLLHLKDRCTLAAVRLADVLYKQCAELALEHGNSLLELFNVRSTAPLTPSLPAPSREGTPEMSLCWQARFMESHPTSYPASHAERQVVRDISDSRKHILWPIRYPYTDPVAGSNMAARDQERQDSFLPEGFAPSGEVILPGQIPVSEEMADRVATPAPQQTRSAPATSRAQYPIHPRVASSLGDEPSGSMKEPDAFEEVTQGEVVAEGRIPAPQFAGDTMTNPRGFDAYLNSCRPSTDVYASQQTSTAATTPATPFGQSTLHNLPPVSQPAQAWGTWKTSSPFSGNTTTSFYTSTVRPSVPTPKPSGTQNPAARSVTNPLINLSHAAQATSDPALLATKPPTVVQPTFTMPLPTNFPQYQPPKGPPPAKGSARMRPVGTDPFTRTNNGRGPPRGGLLLGGRSRACPRRRKDHQEEEARLEDRREEEDQEEEDREEEDHREEEDRQEEEGCREEEGRPEEEGHRGGGPPFGYMPGWPIPGPQGPRGPEGPPGPPGPLGAVRNPPEEPFVFQKKIKWDLVPEWDGEGDTAVKWITEVENFARFGPQAAVELGVIAPTRFTGRLKMMWSMLSDETWAGASRSWQHLSQWVIMNYLGNHW